MKSKTLGWGLIAAACYIGGWWWVAWAVEFLRGWTGFPLTITGVIVLLAGAMGATWKAIDAA